MLADTSINKPIKKVKKVKAKTKPKKKSLSIAHKMKIKKIEVALAKNPEATVREIAQETWIPPSTVQDNLGYVAHIGDKRIDKVISKDQAIITKAQKILDRYLEQDYQVIEKGGAGRLDPKVITKIAQDSTSRFTLFKGDITDDEGGLKDLSSSTTREIEERIKKALWS